jgi:RecA-family ATPase
MDNNNIPESSIESNGSAQKTDDNVIRGAFTDDGRARSLQPYVEILPSEWKGPPPEREWIVEGVFPAGTVAMLSGDGGVGKSLLLQMLLTAAATGKSWLGLPTKPCRAYGFFCEDDEDELWRRQDQINQHYGVASDDLVDLTYTSRVGMENVLMTFDRRTDHPKQTTVFNQLRAAVLTQGAEILVIDTVADVFGGNEIIRNQVRQFINRLRKLALEMAGGKGLVILTQHLSTIGMNTGTGLSGSTAWNNSVRSRLYLTRDKQSNDDGEEDNNCRILRGMKNNYGATGGKVKLRWENGLFRRTDGPGYDGQIERLAMESALVEIVTKIIKNGARPARKPNAQNSLVNIAQQPEHLGRRYKFESLCQAQDRLVKNGRLVSVWLGPPSKRYEFIRTPETRLPGE